jgi:hypothetical protein
MARSAQRDWFLAFILTLGVSPASLAAPLVEYGFDEGSGTNAANSGTLGASLDGTLTAGASYSTDTPSGAGTSLALDGVNDFVRATTAFSYGSAFTVEAWIKASAVNGQRVIWDDYGNPGVLLAIFDGRLQFGISTSANPGPGVSVYSPLLLCADEWIHVAGIYDGTGIRTYVNGVQTGNFVATSGTVIDNSILTSAIGADNITTTLLNFAGRIDDFRIHPTALDPSQLGGGLAHLGHVCLPEPSLAALVGAGMLALLASRTGRRRAA